VCYITQLPDPKAVCLKNFGFHGAYFYAKNFFWENVGKFTLGKVGGICTILELATMYIIHSILFCWSPDCSNNTKLVIHYKLSLSHTNIFWLLVCGVVPEQTEMSQQQRRCR